VSFGVILAKSKDLQSQLLPPTKHSIKDKKMFWQSKPKLSKTTNPQDNFLPASHGNSAKQSPSKQAKHGVARLICAAINHAGEELVPSL